MKTIYKIASFLIGILAIGLFIFSFQMENTTFFFVGALLLVLSILSIVFFMTIDLYKKDKEFNKEQLLAQGLTLIKCKQCSIDNVLEDQYCRICGAKLERDQ